MPKLYRRMRERLCRYAGFRFLFRYEEILRYGIVGVLTTVVNLTVYYVCSRLLFAAQFNENEALCAIACNCISWAFAVVFAFFANRSFVFAETRRGGVLWLQFGSFVLLRSGSGVVENFTPSLLIHLGMHDILAKVLVSVAVIVLNFFFTKFVTFAKRKRPHTDSATAESDKAPLS